jgi:hypothetical protein
MIAAASSPAWPSQGPTGGFALKANLLRRALALATLLLCACADSDPQGVFMFFLDNDNPEVNSAQVRPWLESPNGERVWLTLARLDTLVNPFGASHTTAAQFDTRDLRSLDGMQAVLRLTYSSGSRTHDTLSLDTVSVDEDSPCSRHAWIGSGTLPSNYSLADYVLYPYVFDTTGDTLFYPR